MVIILVKMVEEMVDLVEDNQAVEHLDNQKALEHQVKVLMEEQVLLDLMLLVVAVVEQVLLVKILQLINK